MTRRVGMKILWYYLDLRPSILIRTGVGPRTRLSATRILQASSVQPQSPPGSPLIPSPHPTLPPPHPSAGIPAVPLQKRTSTVPVPSSSPKHALGCSAPLHSRLPQGRAVTARGSAVAGELSMATPVVGEEEMKQWAEGKFPGCSTVVSTVSYYCCLVVMSHTEWFFVL